MSRRRLARRSVRWTLAAALLVPLVTAEEARAARCGGPKICACGDKVMADYVLPADLGPCPKDGLRLGAKVTVDGGGHTIRGPGPGVNGAGIRIGEDASGSQVSNLTVTGFEHGVRLVGARNVRLTAIEAHDNGDPGPREGYGIDVSSAASDNVLERVKVHHNADEGIHFGTNAARNRVVDSEVYGNSRENVYFLSCQDNRLERSRLHGAGSGNASVYVKFARGTVLDGNTIDGGPVQIRGGSSGTQLLGNTLNGGSVILESQNDKRFGPGTPSDTTIRGGRIVANEACVRVESADGTKIEDVEMICPDGVRVGRGSRVALQASSKVPVRCDGGGDACVARVGAADR